MPNRSARARRPASEQLVCVREQNERAHSVRLSVRALFDTLVCTAEHSTWLCRARTGCTDRGQLCGICSLCGAHQTEFAHNAEQATSSNTRSHTSSSPSLSDLTGDSPSASQVLDLCPPERRLCKASRVRKAGRLLPPPTTATTTQSHCTMSECAVRVETASRR